MADIEINKIKERMRCLGATTSQINSATVAMVLLAMQQTDVDAQAFYREQILNEKAELTRKRYEYESLLKDTSIVKEKYNITAETIRNQIAKEVTEREKNVSKREREIQQREKEVLEKEKLYETIEQCETPEARDKIRLAEYYAKNTEAFSGKKIYEERFMPGLSNILGNGGTRSMQVEESAGKIKAKPNAPIII